jgi:hypothetical protein
MGQNIGKLSFCAEIQHVWTKISYCTLQIETHIYEGSSNWNLPKGSYQRSTGIWPSHEQSLYAVQHHTESHNLLHFSIRLESLSCKCLPSWFKIETLHVSKYLCLKLYFSHARLQCLPCTLKFLCLWLLVVISSSANGHWESGFLLNLDLW